MFHRKGKWRLQHRLTTASALRKCTIAPDGAPLTVFTEGFVPGASVFIPCINTERAVQQWLSLTRLESRDITARVQIENGFYGIRIWRKDVVI